MTSQNFFSPGWLSSICQQPITSACFPSVEWDEHSAYSLWLLWAVWDNVQIISTKHGAEGVPSTDCYYPFLLIPEHWFHPDAYNKTWSYCVIIMGGDFVGCHDYPQTWMRLEPFSVVKPYRRCHICRARAAIPRHEMGQKCYILPSWYFVIIAWTDQANLQAILTLTHHSSHSFNKHLTGPAML